MGYEVERPTYLLKFEEHPGLEIRVKSISLGKLKRLTKGLDITEMDEQAMVSAMDEMIAAFVKALESWNLTEDGEPVPATAEGVEDQDLGFIIKITKAWLETVAGVPDGSPLGGRSNSGLPSPAVPLTMAPFSPSQSPFVKLSG